MFVVKCFENYVLVHIFLRNRVFPYDKKYQLANFGLVFQVSIEWAFLVDIPIDQFYFFKLQDMDSSCI